MKNRPSFYFKILMLVAFLCSQFIAAAQDFTVPPKPRQGIADEAQIFDPVGLSDLETMCGQKLLKQVIVKPYVLTIKDTLWSNIDTIITMVCSTWSMYDADSFSLLIMTDAKEPRFRTVSSQLGRLTLSDTLATYLCTKKLPDICRKKGQLAAAKFFIDCIRLDMYTHKTNFGADYTESKFYDQYEHVSKIGEKLTLQEEYDAYKPNFGKPEAPAPAKISGWAVGLYCFFCLAVMIVYLIMWAIYKSAA